jgi:CRISPR/Cas system-associated endonuclease Cas1
MGKISANSQNNDKKRVLSEFRTWTTKSKQFKLASYVKSGKIQSHLKSFVKSATREEKNDLIHEIGNFFVNFSVILVVEVVSSFSIT